MVKKIPGLRINFRAACKKIFSFRTDSGGIFRFALSSVVSVACAFTNRAHLIKKRILTAGAARSLLACHMKSISWGRAMQKTFSVVGNEEKLMEVRLWQAVIVTTIQEWISGPLRRKREAEDYLFKDQRDFPLVCQSAGLDVGQLRTKLARLKPAYEADPLKLRRIWGTMLAQQ